MLVACQKCGIEFDKKPSEVRRSKRHFCSRSCAASMNNTLPKRKLTNRCRSCDTPIRAEVRYCGKSCRDKARETRSQTPEERRERRRLQYAQWRKATKRRAIEHKGGRCLLCGYDRCDRSLHFHHLDPEGKDFSISAVSTGRDWALIETELDKCHGEVHDGLVNTDELVRLEAARDGRAVGS